MPETQKISLPVVGLACAACASSVSSMLNSVEGVQSASVNFGNKTVRIEYDTSRVTLPEMKQTVQSIGYDLVIGDEESRAEQSQKLETERLTTLKKKLIVAVLFSVPVFVISMFFADAIPGANILLLLLTLPVILYSGSEFYTNSLKQIRHAIFTMDTLVAIGTGAAFLLSLFMTIFPHTLHGLQHHVYFESASVIITFILLGRFLEEKARTGASSAIKKLLGLQPKTLIVFRDGEEFEIKAAFVVPGDIVKVKPGERIPVDGNVKAGISWVDESVINGEPVPKDVKENDTVFAGTVNGTGSLVIKAVKPGGDTVLAQIIRLVDEAQSTKPPIQKLVDRIASIFVPVVLMIALITFLAWLFLGNSLNMAFLTSISVLIIACPCALGLATPTALIAGIGRGASAGILIRSANELETARKVNTVVFDKTGTITEGKPVVTNLVNYAKGQPEYLSYLLALESESTHPLAKAVCNYLADTRGIERDASLRIKNLTEIPGSGIRAEINNTLWYAGTRNFIELAGIRIPHNDFAASSVIYFGSGDILVAEIEINDKIKETSAGAIKEFENSGIETIMMTGDNNLSAANIARQAGVSRYYSEVLPDMKGEIIKNLQEQGKIVAMVGDGINDAYALAQANVGIAMGSGSDVALESAGVVLMKSDLQHAYSAIQLSKHTVNKIRQNLFWAFIYNIIMIPLAAGLLYPSAGLLLNPMIAGGAMALSSVTVVTNSLLLKKVKL